MSIPAAPKNSAISRASGAPPEMKIWSLPPVRALIFEKTSLSASENFSFRSGPGSVRATVWAKISRPTPIAQRKIFCRSGGSDATFSFTRAYIFS